MQNHVTTSPYKIHALRRAVQRVVFLHFQAELPTEEQIHDGMTAGELFDSPLVDTLKAEILAAGKRLWQREYVDGNGGNISVRITDELVLCTPTLCSKGALKAEELSIVDLEGRQVYGLRPHTSEILLHLEIYKTTRKARAVVHCHPPYATAHAIAGVIPQGNLIPEQEVFVGQVAWTPYETPGTKAFAELVRPLARQHNTILLGNHGIVCWGDSVEHANWYVEVIETYCRTLSIAQHLRSPLPEISAEKIGDLLAIKKRMGLPDARFPLEAEETTPLQNQQTATKVDREQMKELIDALTLAVCRELEWDQQ